jgi:hypothetical protein
MCACSVLRARPMERVVVDLCNHDDERRTYVYTHACCYYIVRLLNLNLNLLILNYKRKK